MRPEIHIASAIVYTLPQHVEAAAALLTRMPPIQLHGQSPAGKLVVTLEGSTSGEILDQVTAIQQLSQVINVALVYQSIEPDEAAAEAAGQVAAAAAHQANNARARVSAA